MIVQNINHRNRVHQIRSTHFKIKGVEISTPFRHVWLKPI
nr:MAG TPA: hypothetical protein [Herelleviridae sp.]DAM25639.1 MAG TPA: hypothetical protein [Caudoviricetes sp.]DAX48551.1 MAG TPA: hypothetical protein [Caudoviricetes sp.]